MHLLILKHDRPFITPSYLGLLEQVSDEDAIGVHKFGFYQINGLSVNAACAAAFADNLPLWAAEYHDEIKGFRAAWRVKSDEEAIARPAPAKHYRTNRGNTLIRAAA